MKNNFFFTTGKWFNLGKCFTKKIKHLPKSPDNEKLEFIKFSFSISKFKRNSKGGQKINLEISMQKNACL